MTQAGGEPGLATLVTQLASDARDVAKSEVGVVKARAADAFARYRTAALYFAAAGVLALAALIALLVGCILTLATLVGPGYATLIVVGIVFVAAAVLGMIGKSSLTPRKPLT